MFQSIRSCGDIARKNNTINTKENINNINEKIYKLLNEKRPNPSDHIILEVSCNIDEQILSIDNVKQLLIDVKSLRIMV